MSGDGDGDLSGDGDGDMSSTSGDGDGDMSGDGDGDLSGDGDGDMSSTSGDGDGDLSGDGDGDMSSTSGDGDGDGDGACTEAGCPCDPLEDQFCDPGLYCDELDVICIAPLCGDAELEPGEQCDDGNVESGDGCDADCSFTELLQVDASDWNTCALVEGGRVRCWGSNASGQLGYGHTSNIGDDEFPANAGDVMTVAAVQIGASDRHACILTETAGVRCWGLGMSGRLGYGNTESIGDDEAPLDLDVMLGGPVEQLAVGGSHSCALLDSGGVRCWGSGGSGQLGYGNTNAIGDDEHPAAAGDVPIGVDAVAVAAGMNHSCALTVAGKIRCWGANSAGQLGYGHTNAVGSSDTPQAVGDVSAVPEGLPPDTAVSAISLGSQHSCALFETGEVLCWGSNYGGQLGQANTNNLGDNELPSTRPPIPLPGPAIAISAGADHTCALLETRDAVCWGGNYVGELGYGTTEAIGDDEFPGGALMFGGPIQQIDAGANFTCAIREGINELLCWGANYAGQLGYGMTETIGDDEDPFVLGPVPLL